MRSADTAAAQSSLPVLNRNTSCGAVCFLPNLESTCQITFLPKESTDFSPVAVCIFILLDRWPPHPIIAVLFWYKAFLALPSTVLLQKQRTWMDIDAVLNSCLNTVATNVELQGSLHIPHPFRRAFSPLPHPLLFHIGSWQCGGTEQANAPSFQTFRKNCVTLILFSHFSPTLQPISCPGNKSVSPRQPKYSGWKPHLSLKGALTQSQCCRRLQLCFGHSFSKWKLFHQNLVRLNVEHWPVSSQLLSNWNHERVYYISWQY